MQTTRRLSVVGLLLAAVLLSAVPTANAAYVGAWFWQNPIPQGGAIDVADFAGDTAWAVGTGVVLRSYTGGSRWAMQYNVPGGTTSPFMDVEVVDARTVWLLRGDGALLHSTDDGATWERALTTGASFGGEIEFLSADEGWVSGEAGSAWHTMDGGRTWESVDLPTAQALTGVFRYGARVIMTAGTDVLLATAGSTAVSWTASLGEPAVDLAFADASHIVAVSYMGTFSRSADGGKSWSPMRAISRYAMDVTTVCFVSPTVGYCGGATDRLFRTIDGGLTWQPFTPVFRDRAGSVVRPRTSVGDILRTGDRFYLVGGSGALMYSLDRGASWRYVSGDFFDHLVGVSFESTRTGLALAANAAFATTDGGATWRERTVPAVKRYEALSIAANGRGWIVGTRALSGPPYVAGVVYRTADGGRTYSAQATPRSIELLGVWTNDGITGWASGNSGVILRTTNGGATWTRASIDWSGCRFDYPEEHRPIAQVVVLPDGSGLARTYDHLLETADHGQTWRAAGVDRPSSIGASTADGALFVGTWNGDVLRRTTDGWLAVRLPGAAGPVQSVCFLTPDVGYAACGSSIYRTEDGGLTWAWQWAGTRVERMAAAGGTDAWGVGAGGTIMFNGGIAGDFTPPVTRTSAPLGWDDSDAWVTLAPTDATGVDSTWWAIGEPSADTMSGLSVAAGAATATVGDGLVYRPYKSRLRITAEGTTPITYFSRDANGNVERPRTVRVRIDRTRPRVASDARPLYGGSATIRIVASDAGSGVSSIHYSVDGGPTRRVLGSVALVRAGVGTHTVLYWARDRMGHISYRGLKRFAVKPVATLSVSAPMTVTAEATFTVAGTLTPRHTAPAPIHLSVQREIDGAWVATSVVSVYARPTATGSRFVVRLALPEGRWRVRARHSDAIHYPSYSGWQQLASVR